MKQKTKKQYILEFFISNPGKTFALKEIDAEVRRIYEEETGKKEIYINREPRALIKRGFIESINGYIERPKKGHFRFIKGKKPSFSKSPFSETIKKKVKKRDKYKCQMCGLPETGKEVLAVDHIIPEDSGGEGTLKNGITLCNKCNNIKKNLNVTTFGKKLFERYLKISKAAGLEDTVSFIKEVLDVYEKHKKN